MLRGVQIFDKNLAPLRTEIGFSAADCAMFTLCTVAYREQNLKPLKILRKCKILTVFVQNPRFVFQKVQNMGFRSSFLEDGLV